MAVYSSPFGRSAKPVEPEPTAEERAAKARDELTASVQKAVMRIQASRTMSQDEKNRAIQQVYEITGFGQTRGEDPREPNWFQRAVGGTMGVAKRVIAPFAPVAKVAGKAVEPLAPDNNIVTKAAWETYKTLNRIGQSAIQEIGEARAAGGLTPFRPAAFSPVAGVTTPEELTRRIAGTASEKEIATFKAVQAIEGTQFKGSFKDFVKQTVDPDYTYRESALSKAVNANNPITGFVTDLGVEIAADPLTYVTGVGNVKYIGRAGKLSLAQRLSTKEMVERFPQLAGRFNDLVRYGQHAKIEGLAQILKSEGIETGVRIMGQTVKGTDRVAAPVGRAMSGVWEGIMDAVTLVAPDVKRMSPTSRAFMMNTGRKTLGTRTYRVSEETALRNIANWSARQYSAGVLPTQLDAFTREIQDTIAKARELGLDDKLSDLAERANPATIKGAMVFATLPKEQQALVSQYVNWQDQIYKQTEAIYKKFGVDFGSDVPDFSFIEDYIFHKMTKDAKRWITDNPEIARSRGFFVDDNLDAADITDLANPLRYRKLRAPQVLPDGTIKYETFMGEQVKEGTIKELNDIFKKVTKTDINFFETDIGEIARSYAYSMAKMNARESYVRRLMEYGDSAAAKLLHKTIPDPVLSAAAKTRLDEALKIRDSVRQQLNRRMAGLRQVVQRGIKDAEDVVSGNLKQTRMNQRATDAALKRLAVLEDSVRKLKLQGDALTAARRGEFDVVHAALLTDIHNLRVALQTGTVELDEIRLGLQTTYRSMYPNAVRVPDDIDVLADRIAAARGIPASREGRALNRRIAEIRGELDTVAVNSPEYQALQAELARMKDLDNGFRIMAEYRAAQDYAPDNGFLFITGREMGQTGDEVAFKTLRTSTNGYPDKGDVVAVRVYGNDELIDFRASGGVTRMFGYNDFGDGLVEQMNLLGINPEPLQDALDAVRVGLPLDPELEQAFPEVADLVMLMKGNTNREIIPYGEAGLMKEIYEQYVDITTGLLVRMNVDNADYVARQMVDGSIGYVADAAAANNTAKGVLLPAKLFDDAAEADDVVVLLGPSVRLQATDSLTGAIQDSSSPLVQALIRTDADTAMGAARGKLNELASRKAEIDDTTTALKQELLSLQNRKRSLKGAATKRRNAAAAAQERAGTARNLPREIQFADGTTRKMTLAEIDKDMNALTASEQRFRANMERTLVREKAALKEGGLTLRGTEAKLMENRDRLRVLFDEASALSAWDMGTGMVVREEISAAIDVIASMPPAGASAEVVGAWLSDVQKVVKSTSLIDDPAIRNSYERLMQLSQFDEWNLATAEEAAAFARGEVDALADGRFGAIMAGVDERVLKGWEAIAGLGVQVPEEILNVWKPNLAKLLEPKNLGKVRSGVKYLNRFMKTYALGTVGYVVRNMYSAIFMNGVAGVTADQMEAGWKAMLAYNKHGAGRWLDELGLVGVEREQYRQAMLAVEASGRRGLYTEIFGSPVVRGTRREKVLDYAVNNHYTRFIQGSNSRVEDAVRFPLALKAIQDGDDYVGAAQLVTRYHFNYSDLSDADRAFMQFIPFWIWTTRNIPNQLANQWMRPQVYSYWENLQESLPADDSSLMPKWMKEQEAISLARFGLPDVILRPDLPHQRLVKSIESFTTPRGLVGQSFPVYKLPIEAMAQQQLQTGIPFREGLRKPVGVDRVTAELWSLVTPESAPLVRTADGQERMIKEFPSYAIGNLFPLIAQLQRISGGRFGGKESYLDRQNAAIASYFGLPIDFVTERMKGTELIGRKFNLSDYTSMLSKLGLIPTADDFNRGQQSYAKVERERQKRAPSAAKARISAKAKAKAELQEMSDNAKLQAAESKYGKNSAEYKAVKKEIADRKKKEREAAAKKKREQEIKDNPIKVAEE